MKLGKDFTWIARLILVIFKALLAFASNGNEDEPDENGESVNNS